MRKPVEGAKATGLSVPRPRRQDVGSQAGRDTHGTPVWREAARASVQPGSKPPLYLVTSGRRKTNPGEVPKSAQISDLYQLM